MVAGLVGRTTWNQFEVEAVALMPRHTGVATDVEDNAGEHGTTGAVGGAEQDLVRAGRGGPDVRAVVGADDPVRRIHVQQGARRCLHGDVRIVVADTAMDVRVHAMELVGTGHVDPHGEVCFPADTRSLQ